MPVDRLTLFGPLPEKFGESVQGAVGAVAVAGGSEIEHQAPDDGHDERGSNGVIRPVAMSQNVAPSVWNQSVIASAWSG